MAGRWGKPRAFFGLIGEAVWWVTIVDGTLVHHHLKAYDGVLGNRAPEERQRVEGTLAGPALCHQPAADCLLTCGRSERGSVRPDQKEILRAVRLNSRDMPQCRADGAFKLALHLPVHVVVDQVVTVKPRRGIL